MTVKTDKKPRPRSSHWRTDIRKAVAAVELAQTYIEDGALISGARHLRDAADLFEAAQHKRNAAMGRLVAADAR